MNTQDLIRNKKMLAVLLGVAIFATAGVSVASAQVQNSTGQTTQPQIQGSINLQQTIMSNVQTKFSVAADTAASAVSNGKVIGGSLTVAQGYVVYNFKVIDDKNMVYSVIVDPANGKVLYTSTGHQFGMGGFGMGGHFGGMKHKFHMGGYSQNPQQSPQSGTTTPSSDVINPSSES